MEISKKAGRIRGRRFLGVKLQDKRGPRAVEDLGDVPQIPAKHSGPGGVFGNAAPFQMQKHF